jgi:hypothetical protein
MILLTAKDYPASWSTSVQMAQKPKTGWNFFFTGWGTPTAIGPLNAMMGGSDVHPPGGQPFCSSARYLGASWRLCGC